MGLSLLVSLFFLCLGRAGDDAIGKKGKGGRGVGDCGRGRWFLS